jgi:tetratricopeptide (TPR) repeat protein
VNAWAPIIPVLLSMALSLMSGKAFAAGSALPASASDAADKHHWHLRGQVTNLRGEPLSGTEVRVETNLGPSLVRKLETNIKGEFETDFDTVNRPGKSIQVKLAATRNGYWDARENVEFESPDKTRLIRLVMRKEEADGRQLSLEELTVQVGQRLLTPRGADTTSPPPAAGCEQGARELMDAGRAENAVRILNGTVAQHGESVECQTLLGLALLNWGSWFGATEQLNAAARLTVSQQTSPKRAEPFLVLGVLESWEGEQRKAAGFFIRALDADPADSLVLQELGRCYILQRNVEAADAYLVKAIQHGAPVESHLLRAQALLEEGNPAQAQTEMAAYLGNRKPRQLPQAVRYLWTIMEQRVELESTGHVQSVVDQPVADLMHALPELKGLQAADDQQQLGAILKRVGQNVESFFSSFPSTTALEQLRMERLHRDGSVAEAHNQDFQYLVLTQNPKASHPNFEEYRTDGTGSRAAQGGLGGRFMVTQGFAAASLHFHPSFRRGCKFRYLGRQSVDGRDHFVLAFAQRAETAEVLESFRVGQVGTVVLIQGLAWVDASTYQIRRLRTDLLRPLPLIHLDRQTTDISFKEVFFTDVKSDLWLPRQVAVTVDWNGHVYRNWHTYSDFKLFNVEARHKVPAPETPVN